VASEKLRVPTHHIDRLDDPRIADYRNVPDPVLLRERGIFVAEGRLVVQALLDEPRYHVRSLLLSPAAFDAIGPALAARPGLDAFVAPLDLLAEIVGFNIHRGCLAIGERRPALDPGGAIAAAGASRLILVLERVANADNIGVLFRNARAFGAGCVLLSPGCCDPLYRKAIRVSIGASLRVPFANVPEWPGGLSAVRAAGFEIVALTPRAGAVELGTAAHAAAGPVALLLGHEGDGLSAAALAAADRGVRIAMAAGTDSINVASAAAIALHAFAARGR
jgi:tRNA G18 (ribose-2'-O)-methylase SpoU